jgi:hypothetical protein
VDLELAWREGGREGGREKREEMSGVAGGLDLKGNN